MAGKSKEGELSARTQVLLDLPIEKILGNPRVDAVFSGCAIGVSMSPNGLRCVEITSARGVEAVVGERAEKGELLPMKHVSHQQR